MTQVTLNYLAIFIAGLIPMITGFLWYGPLFGKQWMKEVGLKKESMKQPNPVIYLIMFVGALIQSYVLAHFISFANATTTVEGMATGAWAALGFVATTQLANFLFSGKSKQLYFIDIGYHLLNLLLMGAVLGGWR
jgi:hypothetical protein